MGDDRRRNASDDTRCESHAGVQEAPAVLRLLAHTVVHGLGSAALHRELGHRVGDLLEEDGAEAGVEATDDALLLQETRGHARQAGTVGRVRDSADAASLQRAQEAVRNELGARGGAKVDSHAVVPGLLLTHRLGRLDLEDLNAAELEPALDEVADASGAKSRGERHRTLLGDDRPEAGSHALVVLLRLQLDARLHNINRAHGTMRDAAADAARQG
mmetsp:Transcript_21441/g.56773  ORF Transcript_21441/g.56773 Transcript_21441/m.56773 type:complete len:216 (+) Transcript_21441:396-1043(+)